jgi:DNA-binding IclR family transcriptional regulator
MAQAALNRYDRKMEQRVMSDQEKILGALREKPLKVYEIMRRANISNEESCQSLLLRMRNEGSVKFDIHKGRWFIG